MKRRWFKEQFAMGINVVVDYLWGRSAEVVLIAIAKAVDDGTPVRFIHVGGASGTDINLPGAALRSASTILMGSGQKSIPLPRLLASTKSVFDSFMPARLSIRSKTVPLAEVGEVWDDKGKSRIVFALP